VRRGTHVTFTGWAEELAVAEYDEAFEGSPTHVTYTEWSDPPIEPDTTYYFAFTHEGDFTGLSVEAIIVVPAEPEPAEEPVAEYVAEHAEDAFEDASDVDVDVVEDAARDVPADPDTEDGTAEDDGPPVTHVVERHGCGC